MDGFVNLIKDLLVENGVPEPAVFAKKSVELPGYFRPEKQWDLLVVLDEALLVSIEFKSHVGPSYGNNYNNRTEEALGSASDILAAYREGAFKPSARPWLGYVMLLEEAEGSTSPVRTREPHFRVFEEFRGASYAKRYEILLTKLLRERLYDGTCLLLSRRTTGAKGQFSEPSPELRFKTFAAQLVGHAMAAVQVE